MRAIRRSARHEDLVRNLAETPHPQAGRAIFPTMRELLCFAAVLGFEMDKRKPLDATTKEIDGRTFEGHEQSLDLIYLLALAHEKDADILHEENDDKCVSIFEEYVDGGLDEIGAWLRECPHDPHGDTAILDALHRHGYLGGSRGVDDAVHDVQF